MLRLRRLVNGLGLGLGLWSGTKLRRMVNSLGLGFWLCLGLDKGAWLMVCA